MVIFIDIDLAYSQENSAKLSCSSEVTLTRPNSNLHRYIHKVQTQMKAKYLQIFSIETKTSWLFLKVAVSSNISKRFINTLLLFNFLLCHTKDPDIRMWVPWHLPTVHTGCLVLEWMKQIGSDRWTNWDSGFMNQFSKR